MTVIHVGRHITMNMKSLSRNIANLVVNARQRSRPNRRKGGKPYTATVNNGRQNYYQASPNNQSWGRSLPAAYASHVRPRFNILSRNGDQVRVGGCDLVYALPNVIPDETGLSLFSVIPSNPAYWTGTRIAQFAPAYMNFRPISLTFSYIPQVAVTQPGTVIMGTLWNGSSGDEDLQQTLFTSNGGCMTQCYVPADTSVKLGNNLQQNLFTLSGAISPDTSPFIFVAAMRGGDVVPGYFYVSYVFDFKNPVGASWTYRRSLATSVLSLSPSLPNRSVVLLEQWEYLGPGTVVDMEGNNFYYQGTPVLLSPDTTVQLFENGQKVVTGAVLPVIDLSSWSLTGTKRAWYDPVENEVVYAAQGSAATGLYGASDLDADTFYGDYKTFGLASESEWFLRFSTIDYEVRLPTALRATHNSNKLITDLAEASDNGKLTRILGDRTERAPTRPPNHTACGLARPRKVVLPDVE